MGSAASANNHEVAVTNTTGTGNEGEVKKVVNSQLRGGALAIEKTPVSLEAVKVIAGPYWKDEWEQLFLDLEAEVGAGEVTMKLIRSRKPELFMDIAGLEVKETESAHLSEQDIKIIMEYADFLSTNARRITNVFYPSMMTRYPEAKLIFNVANQRNRQPQAMANTIISYTHNINNIPILTSLFAFIACKHCGMQILPHQYTMIHDNMIASIKEVLKDEIPQELVDAMSRAIRHMEKILVGAEESMYQAAEKRSGGFRGWKNFVIQKITQEATNIKTFRIVPEDPSSVNGPFAFTAGQYLTISLPNEPPRHYTVTSPPNVDYLEFTVKLLDHGIISNALHGMTEGHVIKVSPPFGLYTIEDNNKHGVVLISAGIGATPMKAFLQHIGEKCRKFVHIDKCQATVPFYDFFEENNAGKNSFYYTMEGRPDLGEVVNTLVDEVGIEPLFYVCGPPPFMQSIAKLLHIKGVTMERIKWEAFGPQISCPMMS